jgi:hypothetical protein
MGMYNKQVKVLSDAICDYRPSYIFYKEDCADSFTAAWVFWKKYGPGASYVACHYGVPLTQVVSGTQVVFSGFAYSRAAMKDIALTARNVLVLDFHRSPSIDLQDAILNPIEGIGGPNVDNMNEYLHLKGSGIHAVMDSNKTAATMAWDFCFPGVECPELCKYVEDAALGAYVLPNSRVVNAALQSYPFDFDTWSHLARMCSHAGEKEEKADPKQYYIYRTLMMEGAALLHNENKIARMLIAASECEMEIGGFLIRAANAPSFLATFVGEALDTRNSFGASYYDSVNGRVFLLRRKYDFRTEAVDVSKVACKYGGGGTATAAGFIILYENRHLYPGLWR